MQARPNLYATSPFRPLARTGVNLAKQAGAGMVDLIMYIFGVVAIVGFVFWMKSVAWGPLLGWMEATAVSSQISKIENVYSGAANYTGLATASMATPSIFSAKYLPGGGVIHNRFGGLVTLGIAMINTTADTLQYTDGGVRSDSCTTMVNQLVDDADRISVGGQIVKDVNATLNAGLLKTQCDSGAGNIVPVLIERIKRS